MTLTLLHPRGVTVPAGTPSTAPVELPTTFPPGIVESVQWRFPGGCNGQVGIRILSSHAPMFPGSTTEWIVQSGDIDGHDVDGFPDSGDFSVLAYNTGSFQHIIQVTYRVHRMEPDEPEPGYLVADLVGTMRGGY